MKKKIALIFLLLSLILFLIPISPTITGNVITTNIIKSNPVFYFSSLISLCISLILFLSRKSLDAIIIPTAPSKEKAIERTKRAEKSYHNKKPKYFLISGAKEENSKLKDTQRKTIYDELRSYGIQPRNIRIEGESKDTLENILYSLKKLKKLGAKEIGIASNPSHLNRFEKIIQQGKKEGIIDEDLKIYRLETPETFGESIYGFFASLLNQYKLRNGIKNYKEMNIPSWIKEIGDYIFGK